MPSEKSKPTLKQPPGIQRSITDALARQTRSNGGQQVAKTSPSAQASRVSMTERTEESTTAEELRAEPGDVPAWLERWLGEMERRLDKKLDAYFGNIEGMIERAIAPLKDAMAQQTTGMGRLQTRLGAAEQRVSDAEDGLVGAQRNIKLLQDKCHMMESQIENFENATRKNVIRLVGISEGREGNGDPRVTAGRLIQEMAAQQFKEPPKIDRAYRAFQATQRNIGKPRHVLVTFNSFEDKLRVLRASRAKKLVLDGKTIRAFPDYSPKVSKQRAAFSGVKQALFRRKIQHNMLFPARLKVYGKDEPEQVEEYLRNLERKEMEQRDAEAVAEGDDGEAEIEME